MSAFLYVEIHLFEDDVHMQHCSPRLVLYAVMVNDSDVEGKCTATVAAAPRQSAGG